MDFMDKYEHISACKFVTAPYINRTDLAENSNGSGLQSGLS